MEDLNDTFAAIHQVMAEKLLEKMQSGEASAQELSVIRQFLKDNDVTISAQAMAANDSPIRKLADLVPFPEPEIRQG